MLTPAQQATLAADICTSPDQAVIDALAARNDSLLAEIYNTAGTFIVWQTQVSLTEVWEAVDWAEYSVLNVSNQNAFSMMTQPGYLQTGLANIRAGLADVFEGPGQVNTRTALIAAAKRAATRLEELFATGTGTDGDPGALVVDGQIGIYELSVSLNNNPCA